MPHEMITFTRHVEPAGAPAKHTVDAWHQDAVFHLASLDGRVPGVTFTGEIKVTAENGEATYRVIGVDSRNLTILAVLEKHKLTDHQAVHEGVSYAPTNPHVEHIHSPLADIPSSEGVDLTRANADARGAAESRRAEAARRADEARDISGRTLSGQPVPYPEGQSPEEVRERTRQETATKRADSARRANDVRLANQGRQDPNPYQPTEERITDVNPL